MKAKNITLVSVAVITLIAFIIIAVNYDSEFIISMDEYMESLLFTTNGLIIGFMEGISFLGSAEILMIFTIILMVWTFFRRKDLWMTLLLIMVMGGGVVLNLALKFMFERGRPDDVSNLDIFGYTFEWVSYSFPSGHAMRAFLFYGFVIYLIARFVRSASVRFMTILLMVIIILLIGASRIMLDAHFSSDIIAAYIISLTWITFWIFIYRLIPKSSNKYNQHLEN